VFSSFRVFVFLFSLWRRSSLPTSRPRFYKIQENDAPGRAKQIEWQLGARPELVNYEPLLPDLVRAVPFGTGFIDYGAFFSGLRAGGFDGIATFEMCSPIRGGGGLDNLDRYARGYLDWMRQHALR
jgi:sugar phosphate isomerase/epimerase